MSKEYPLFDNKHQIKSNNCSFSIELLNDFTSGHSFRIKLLCGFCEVDVHFK